MHKTFSTLLVTALLTLPAFAQTPAQPTAAELLQKAIFAQDTSGNLDDAIKLYHQIADLHPQQREIGAQAQYRLGMALLAKGDTNSASQEIQRLGWDYPDFKDLIASAGKPGQILLQSGQILLQGSNKAFFFSRVDQSRVAEIDRLMEDQKTQLAALRTKYNDSHPEVVKAQANLTNLQEMRRRAQLDAAGPAHVFTPTPAELQQLAESRDHTLFLAASLQPAEHETLFDFNQSQTITGTVVQINFSTPYSMLTVNNSGALTNVFLASANTLNIAGWNRNTVRNGDSITITGAPARDGSNTLQATEVSTNGKPLFSRPNGPLPQTAMGAYEK